MLLVLIWYSSGLRTISELSQKAPLVTAEHPFSSEHGKYTKPQTVPSPLPFWHAVTYIHVYVCTYMCVCVCTCVRVCVYAYMRVCVGGTVGLLIPLLLVQLVA